MPIDYMLLQGIAVYLSIKCIFLVKGKKAFAQLHAGEFAFTLFLGSLVAKAIMTYQVAKICVFVGAFFYLCFYFIEKIRFYNERKAVAKTINHKPVAIPLPLIIDGAIQYEGLNELKQTELWLRQQLRKFGYRDVRKIAYCSIKGKQSFFIDPV